MTSQSFISDPEHWRTRAEEARILAKEMKDSETKDALLRIGDNYEYLVEWVEAGPCGVYQRTERLEPKEGHYMSIEAVLLILIVSFACGFVLDRWHMRLSRSRRRPAVRSQAYRQRGLPFLNF